MINKQQTSIELRLKELGAWSTLILIGIGLVLITAELIFDRHGDTPMEDLPVFPAAVGFISSLLVVLGGVILRKVIMRERNYYGDN